MGVLISLGGNRPNEFEWKRRNWYNLKLEFIHDARTKFLMRRVSTCVHYYTGVNNSFFASLQQDMQWNHVVSHLIWVFLTVQNTERDGRKRLSCHINSVMSFEINGSLSSSIRTVPKTDILFVWCLRAITTFISSVVPLILIPILIMTLIMPWSAVGSVLT